MAVSIPIFFSAENHFQKIIGGIEGVPPDELIEFLSLPSDRVIDEDFIREYINIDSQHLYLSKKEIF